MCVFVCVLRLYPATPGWAVRCRSVCLDSGFAWHPATPGWGVGVCGFSCALRLYPASPGWGVRCRCGCLGSGFGCAPPLLAGVLGCVCVCLCVRSACTLPLMAGVCGVGVCAWALVLAAIRHSWLGCRFWCLFVCALCLYFTTPGSGVWCRCRFRLRPAIPGWGVGLCVCLCAHSACTLQLLAGACGVGVRAWAQVTAAPRHSWQGCWAVCVFVCALRLYPATPGWGVRCVCVCLSSGVGFAPPLLAGMLGCVCVCVRAPLGPVRLQAGACGAGVCAWALVLAAPRHSWLGRWGGCGCFCARSACTPPLLAGVCGVGLCAWARVSAAPRQS